MQGACPLHWYTSLIPALVCMFNPSSAIHFLSQFCYTCFIWIVKVTGTGSRVVQWIHQRQINGGPLERCCPKGDSHSLPGASTLDPPPHVSFNHQTYTSLIYIFYSNLYITNINSIHSYLLVLKLVLHRKGRNLKFPRAINSVESALWNTGSSLGKWFRIAWLRSSTSSFCIHRNGRNLCHIEFQDLSIISQRSFHGFQVQSLYIFFPIFKG